MHPSRSARLQVRCNPIPKVDVPYHAECVWSNKMRHAAGLSLIALLAANLSLLAQNPAEPSRGPDNGPRTIIPGIETPPYPGLPFTGIDNIVWTRTTADGATTTLCISARVVRDGQGRLYR